MLKHPAAWRPEELRRNPDWQQQWTPEELAELREAALAGDDGDAVAAALRDTAAGRRMARVQDVLENGCGGVWLQGVDPGEFSPRQLENLFSGVCSLVGTPVSQSAADERLFHVRDEGFGEQDTRTRGPNTNKRLSFHTDRCDVIAFLCVRNAAEGGDNQLVSSMALYNDIAAERPDLLEVLQRDFLYRRHNVDPHHPQRYISQPVFAVYEGHFAANFLRVLIERAYAADDTPELEDRQREALDLLEAMAESPERHVTFRQNPGDLVFLNNFVTFHRRTAFTDDPDPAKRRHLLRVWLSVPNSRPLDPRFAGNYGSTEAGAVRGGMHGSKT